MLSAELLTIGTEITNGEILNSNASWISQRLEEMGVRVLTHLSVRDRMDEILKGLRFLSADLAIVTGGLGPTSDDLTRKAMAEFLNRPLEFSPAEWRRLATLYSARNLQLRDAHRWQCQFPKDAVLIGNPVGTASGFSYGERWFVLPGPPRELQAMWQQSVEGEIRRRLPDSVGHWRRWTCQGVPESEVAEVVEPIVRNRNVEIGYRAQSPLVRVKLWVDSEENARLAEQIRLALEDWLIIEPDSDKVT